MNAQALEQTSATPTLCVTTLKDPTSVVVLVVIRVMEETAQTSMNVKMEKILVTRMHCVPIPREVTCAVAFGVLREMAGHA